MSTTSTQVYQPSTGLSKADEDLSGAIEGVIYLLKNFKYIKISEIGNLVSDDLTAFIREIDGKIVNLQQINKSRSTSYEELLIKISVLFDHLFTISEADAQFKFDLMVTERERELAERNRPKPIVPLPRSPMPTRHDLITTPPITPGSPLSRSNSSFSSTIAPLPENNGGNSSNGADASTTTRPPILGGGYREKYLKYKKKYLTLKSQGF